MAKEEDGDREATSPLPAAPDATEQDATSPLPAAPDATEQDATSPLPASPDATEQDATSPLPARPEGKAPQGISGLGGRLLSWARGHRQLAVGIAAALVACVAVVAVLAGRTSGDAVFVQRVGDVSLGSAGGTQNRYPGVVESQDTQKVAFDSSRTLGELKVSEGDHVSKGDVLFTYDTAATELQAQQAELAVEQCETTIANANDDIARVKSTMAGLDAADRLEAAAKIQQCQATIAQATYDMKTKQAEAERLRAAVDDPAVRAEISGVVDKVGDPASLSQGAGSDASSSGDGLSDGGGTSPDAFVTIIADGDFRVRADVTEQTIAQLSQGAPVVVRSRVDTNETWEGTISAISTSPESVDADAQYVEGGSDTGNKASSYAFYVTLDGTDGLLLGQHVTVELAGDGGARTGVWLDEGWFETDDDGSAYVWAAPGDGGRLERRRVTLGEHDEELAAWQVTDGLSETDYLAWPDPALAEGDPTTTAPPFTDASASDGEAF